MLIETGLILHRIGTNGGLCEGGNEPPGSLKASNSGSGGSGGSNSSGSISDSSSSSGGSSSSSSSSSSSNSSSNVMEVVKIAMRMGFCRDEQVCSAPSNTVTGIPVVLQRPDIDRAEGVTEERLNWVRGRRVVCEKERETDVGRGMDTVKRDFRRKTQRQERLDFNSHACDCCAATVRKTRYVMRHRDPDFDFGVTLSKIDPDDATQRATAGRFFDGFRDANVPLTNIIDLPASDGCNGSMISGEVMPGPNFIGNNSADKFLIHVCDYKDVVGKCNFGGIGSDGCNIIDLPGNFSTSADKFLIR
ncbi:hypothetical protein ANN_04098 [Periplaneta americana]|uniref:Uncharacterized protein n=1 Tax=Periplaneta americana TaxID=6978 RepID=A0ABQ8T7M9_PERAM|nr:hypothetical protein ANN_04098 [Periplaneta americana]